MHHIAPIIGVFYILLDRLRMPSNLYAEVMSQLTFTLAPDFLYVRYGIFIVLSQMVCNML